MRKNGATLFRGRHFEDQIIILCVRWYLRYSLSYRDVQELMAERGLSVDHTTVWRWVQRYAPILNQRIRREVRHPNRSWRIDETYIRMAGRWVYLYRAVDSCGETIEFMLSPKRDLVAAKHFLQLALWRAGHAAPVSMIFGNRSERATPTRALSAATSASAWRTSGRRFNRSAGRQAGDKARGTGRG